MATLTFCGVEYCKGRSNLLDKKKGQYGSFVIMSSCPCNTRRFHVTACKGYHKMYPKL